MAIKVDAISAAAWSVSMLAAGLLVTLVAAQFREPPVYQGMSMEQAMQQIAYAAEVQRCNKSKADAFGCYIDRRTLKIVYLGSDGQPIKCIPLKDEATYC